MGGASCPWLYLTIYRIKYLHKLLFQRKSRLPYWPNGRLLRANDHPHLSQDRVKDYRNWTLLCFRDSILAWLVHRNYVSTFLRSSGVRFLAWDPRVERHQIR